MKKMNIFFIIAGLILFSCNNADKTQKEDPNVKKTYRQDGSLLATYTMKDGKYNGVAYNYYKNGKVNFEFNYVNGLKEGIVKRFYEDEKLYSTTPYVHDTIDGIRKLYFKNGIVSSETPYKKGNLEPGLKEYYDSGKLKTEDISIIVTPIDKTKNKYQFKLSKKIKNARFFSLSGNYPFYKKTEMPVKEGIATITLDKKAKEPLMIEAQITTEYGGLQIIRTSVE